MSSAALDQRKILLGISGGIAAYKCPELVRRLKEQGAEVRVVLTPSAKAFVSPLSLQAVCGNPVHEDLLDPAAEAAMGHIELARWADLVIIAPASANLSARLAAGMGNDLLSTIVLATTKPVALAPAMNQAMWQNSATQANTTTLLQRGFLQWGPDSGDQACGENGPGRMLDPDDIVAKTVEFFQSNAQASHSDIKQTLTGRRCLITAGPTREALDPVRYISNHSSGKMGFAVAAAAAAAGAEVTLVAGPVQLDTPPGVTRLNVQSAEDMLEKVQQYEGAVDIFIGTAAVADYRAADINAQKIKKSADEMTIKLVKNPDILAHVAKWQQKPFCVGFAAETQNIIDYAKDKFTRKGLDMIAANDVSGSEIGFNSDDNALTVIWPAGQQEFAKASKVDIARQLVSLIAKQLP